MRYKQLHTSADLVLYAQSLERGGAKLDYSQMRADWESAQVRKFWVRFDLLAGIVIASCLVFSLTTVALWAAVVLLGGFYFYMGLTERVYL